MPSSRLDTQTFAQKILESHLLGDRLSHTYLVTGEGKEAKDQLALAFAQALNCEKGKPFCDCSCASCGKIYLLQHPDVLHVGRDEKDRSIKIEEIKEVLKRAFLKPFEGKWKVFIFHEADRLTVEASNALLKTLEEPPARTIFILLAEHKEGLLPTLQSRAFEIRVKPALPAEENRDRQIGTHFESFFESAQTVSRDEVKEGLDRLLRSLQALVRKQNDPRFVEAMTAVLEAKEALDDNTNQKLTLSRLEMRFSQTGVNSLEAR